MSARKERLNRLLGFDDTVFMLISLPLLNLFATMVLCGAPASDFFVHFWLYYPHGLAFTLSYWLINRAVMMRLRKRFPEVKDTAKRVLINITFALLLYPIISFVIHFGMNFILELIGLPDFHEPNNVIGVITVLLMIFFVMTIYEAMYFFKQYKMTLISQERIRTEHVNTQLINLRNQVNPHFLFNSLNTLMSLIPQSAVDAHHYLSKLSSFYRYSVSEKDEMLVPLSRELEIVRLYGDLIGERFGTAIDIDIDVETTVGEQILPMSLQLLVENAVKHNIVSKDEPLKILMYRNNGSIHVENTVQARITETESTGMGLKNIRQRFSLVTKDPVEVYKENGRFKVSIPVIRPTR